MFVIELIQEIWWKLKPRPQAGRSATRAVGDKAEQFALAYLKKECGFKLIEQGMHDEDGELDLVGRIKGNEGLVVVEVRARTEGGLVSPRDAVDFSKQRQVVETARRLLPRKGFHDVLRFDIVGVWLDQQGAPARAEHFADAFDRNALRR
ncbi:MAG: YraN family protein [Planctomycetes bacterium]|nr:YraN family protein [Planctomycetota bacterium]